MRELTTDQKLELDRLAEHRGRCRVFEAKDKLRILFDDEEPEGDWKLIYTRTPNWVKTPTPEHVGV